MELGGNFRLISDQFTPSWAEEVASTRVEFNVISEGMGTIETERTTLGTGTIYQPNIEELIRQGKGSKTNYTITDRAVHYFDINDKINIRAKPNDGYQFQKWIVKDLEGDSEYLSASTKMYIKGWMNITAVFEKYEIAPFGPPLPPRTDSPSKPVSPLNPQSVGVFEISILRIPFVTGNDAQISQEITEKLQPEFDARDVHIMPNGVKVKGNKITINVYQNLVFTGTAFAALLIIMLAIGVSYFVLKTAFIPKWEEAFKTQQKSVIEIDADLDDWCIKYCDQLDEEAKAAFDEIRRKVKDSIKQAEKDGKDAANIAAIDIFSDWSETIEKLIPVVLIGIVAIGLISFKGRKTVVKAAGKRALKQAKTMHGFIS